VKHKAFTCLIIFICLSLAFSGCASQGRATDLMADIKPSQNSNSPDQIDKNIKKEINAFSADLFKQSAENEGNIVISPISVYLALAMALNGADGETKTAMLNVMADQGLTVDRVNNACRSWIGLLEKTGSKTKLKIANSIWFDQDFTPNKTVSAEKRRFLQC